MPAEGDVRDPATRPIVGIGVGSAPSESRSPSSGPASSLLTFRSRWQAVQRQQPAETLRIHLLASFTVDPLVPYLGLSVHDAGLPATVTVGPSNQILQQLLDRSGELFRLPPDVLVVAPRFEELGGLAGAVTGALGGWAELRRIADVAVAAAGAFEGCLVFVLPALPESRPSGVGDAGNHAGVVATATRLREEARARLAGVPNVLVADADEAVRTVGTRNAYHPALYRFAKVPYTEPLFACLADQLGRLLRTRFGSTIQVAVLDMDSLLEAEIDDGSTVGLMDALRPSLLELRRAGVRIAVRATTDLDGVWRSFAVSYPELLGELVYGGDRPGRSSLVEELQEIASQAGVPLRQTVLLTLDHGRVAEAVCGTPTAVVLARQPDSWLADLRTAGVFDRMPGVDRQPSAVSTVPGLRAVQDGPSMSLAEFVAGLDVVVTCGDVGPGEFPKVIELVERAKTFTLGIQHTAPGLAARTSEIVAVGVRDRLGDHGISAAVAMRPSAGTAVVDLFSVSCAVLGRDVENGIVQDLVERAARHRCAAIVFRFRPTGQNEIALRFIQQAEARSWTAGSGEQVSLHVERVED